MGWVVMDNVSVLVDSRENTVMNVYPVSSANHVPLAPYVLQQLDVSMAILVMAAVSV